MTENRYLAACAAIPRGETRTFAELAALAGKPGAARAAGRAVAECPRDADVAWQRVVAADGSLARDPARAADQLERLRAEDARPRAGEGNAEFARRTGRALLGSFKTRRAFELDDPALDALAPHAVEGLADAQQAAARGFVRARDVAGARTRRRATAAQPLGALPSTPSQLAQRFHALDWERARLELWERGRTVIERALSEDECQRLVRTFAHDDLFERTIEMAPRGYGVGRYRYFREPMPEPAHALRQALYAELREIAERVPGAGAFPPSLTEFWEECRLAGQQRTSSIVLRYARGGVNHPHRDIYGKRWFPFQAVCVLSRRELDFRGGEFTLLRARADGAELPESLPLDQGDLCVFASRSAIETRGTTTRWIGVRHGMRAVTDGQRYALGLVLHLAE